MAPNGTVDISGGVSGNVVASNVGTKVTVDLAPNLSLTSVTTGATKMDTTGVTVGSVALRGTGLDNGGNTITNVAAGVAGTDAVNVNQLNAVKATAGQGINVTTSSTGTGTVTGTAVTQVASGQTATFTAGNNIAITQKGAEVQVALNPVVTGLTSLAFTASTVNLSGAGLNNGGNVITNIAAGVGLTDAVNLGQLNKAVAGAGSSPVQYSNSATPTTINGGVLSNDVTLVGLSGPVVIHNVGVGVLPNDAVNVSQLSAASGGKWQTATSNTFVFGNPAGTPANGPVTLTNIGPALLSSTSTEAVNGSQLYATNQAINNLSGMVNHLSADAKAGTASAMALGMIRYDDRPGKFSMGMAGAVYGGQGGMAMGAGYTSENQRLRASAGASWSPTNSNADVGVGASVTWTFN